MSQDKSKIFDYSTFLVVFLGMIFGFGPFVTDMYLPALPQLMTCFDTREPLVQLTLSASMIGLAAGQLFWGPLSEKYGRRGILKISLYTFIVSTIGCIFSSGIGMLAVMRLFQGIGGSGGIVLSRSIATDLYKGKGLARMMAIIGAINGIAPVLAALLGGILTDIIGWRGIFAMLLLLGVILTFLCHFFKESLPAQNRCAGGVSDMFHAFGVLLKDKPYVFCILQYGFLHGVFFSYLSSSPFIVQQHYGFSVAGYTLLFTINAAMIGIASVLSMKFSSTARCTFTSSLVLFIMSLAIAPILIFDGPVWIYEGCTIVQIFCCGLSFASTPAITMEAGRINVGAASALLGVSTFAFGSIVSPLSGTGNTMVSTSVLYVICSAMTLFFAYKILKHPDNQ